MRFETPKHLSNKVTEFIQINELDYDIIDNGISPYSLNSSDNMVFYIIENENILYLIEYDSNSDKPGQSAYKYNNFNTVNELLTYLSERDNSIPKNYWTQIISDAELPTIGREEDWYKGILENGWTPEEDNSMTLVRDCRPILLSPFNTLSPLNTEQAKYTPSKLEINIRHQKENIYIARILLKEDNLFPEYSYWLVWTKKGLKLFTEGILNNVLTA